MRKHVILFLFPFFCSCTKEVIDKRDCRATKYLSFPYAVTGSLNFSTLIVSDGNKDYYLFRNSFTYSDTLYLGVLNDTCVYYTYASNLLQCLNCSDNGSDIKFQIVYKDYEYFENYIRYPTDFENSIWDSIFLHQDQIDTFNIGGNIISGSKFYFPNSPYIKSIIIDYDYYSNILEIETLNGRKIVVPN